MFLAQELTLLSKIKQDFFGGLYASDAVKLGLDSEALCA